MRIKKLEKFAQNRKSENVIEPGKELFETIKGNWKNYFGNEYDLVVELACGWGEYTTALAEKFPQKNFVGVDIKGDRLWKGSQYAEKKELSNVAFLRCHIIEILNLFDEDEVDEIWLTFPDPQPKDRNEKHRLSNRAFLEKYRYILKPEGSFRFKTDDTLLFEYTLRVLSDFEIIDFEFTFDLHRSNLLDDHFGIRTKYEKIWIEKGKKIKYMKFRFNA
ncbi:MAG: tRNA (guanosine(46)-N7)-methyltransferase TrmB [Bacteroidota bacterium]